jgi:UDP-3-O-[3-hydroxymyristoyl] glucosamine N-acyltransferase
MRLDELAGRLGIPLEGEGAAEIMGCAPIEEAGEHDLTFLANPRYARRMRESRAAAVIVGPGVEAPGRNVLRAANPQAAFAKALALFDSRPKPVPGIHPTAVIATTATIGDGGYVGAYCVIGEEAMVGAEAVIHPHVTIYPRARIGKRFVAHAGSVVREDVVIGDDVTLQPGAVVGSDGFGFLPRPGDLPVPIPQIGTVELGDHADVGANTTIDRAAVGRTRIGRGVKLDNLVQVAHGCQIGDGTMLAAQTGLAGSTRLGRDILAGGQVGFAGHLQIGDGVQIAAQTGVPSDVAAGTVVAGTPAMDIALWRRCMAALRRLPEILSRLRAVEERVGTNPTAPGKRGD